MQETPASRTFDALDDAQKLRLAREVFEVLEYDENDQPGGEWSSDTTQALGDLFNEYGVVFTPPPGEVDDDN